MTRDAEALLVDALAAIRTEHAAPKFFDAEATVEDGQLVLRMPIQNIRATRVNHDRARCMTTFSVEFVNGVQLEVDRATYELICERLK